HSHIPLFGVRMDDESLTVHMPYQQHASILVAGRAAGELVGQQGARDAAAVGRASLDVGDELVRRGVAREDGPLFVRGATSEVHDLVVPDRAIDLDGAIVHVGDGHIGHYDTFFPRRCSMIATTSSPISFASGSVASALLRTCSALLDSRWRSSRSRLFMPAAMYLACSVEVIASPDLMASKAVFRSPLASPRVRCAQTRSRSPASPFFTPSATSSLQSSGCWAFSSSKVMCFFSC